MYSPSFKPPKMGASPFNPIHEQRSIDLTKRTTNPMGGPLDIPHPQGMPPVQGMHPLDFNKLKAMFARGK